MHSTKYISPNCLQSAEKRVPELDREATQSNRDDGHVRRSPYLCGFQPQPFYYRGRRHCRRQNSSAARMAENKSERTEHEKSPNEKESPDLADPVTSHVDDGHAGRSPPRQHQRFAPDPSFL
jgi:hypothetical protein